MALHKEQDGAYLTEAEYLATELSSDIKREYINGQAFIMASTGYNHNCIAGNIYGEFRNHLKGTPCTTFLNEIKLHMENDYVYPDILVDCRKMAGDDYFSTSPVIIVEVISRTTRKTDTTIKLLRYTGLPTLQEYVLIEQDFVSIQVMRRKNQWLPEYYYLGEAVTFDSIGLKLMVEEIYDRVDNPDMVDFREKSSLA